MDRMRELVATNDHVLLTFIEALLKDAGIDCVVLDRNMSALEGSIGVLPRRVIVEEAAWYRARYVLAEAGLHQWIAGDDA